jgi:hypothetical protein
MSTGNYNVCDCSFTVRSLCDFLDTFGRAPKSNDESDCMWVGKRIDSARNFNGGERFQKDSGRFAIVNYWKCRRMGVKVPLRGNKVGVHPI